MKWELTNTKLKGIFSGCLWISKVFCWSPVSSWALFAFWANFKLLISIIHNSNKHLLWLLHPVRTTVASSWAKENFALGKKHYGRSVIFHQQFRNGDHDFLKVSSSNWVLFVCRVGYPQLSLVRPFLHAKKLHLLNTCPQFVTQAFCLENLKSPCPGQDN